MFDFAQITRSRRTPGVIILDREGSVRYFNQSVEGIIPLLCALPDEGLPSGNTTIPATIRTLCRKVGYGAVATASDTIVSATGTPYAVRLFPLTGVAEPGEQLVMLLVEPVVEHRHVDFDAVRAQFRITRREQQVLRLVCQGLSNKEIAERLFISEHTAKDHVKRLLQAFGASSRSEVIALLLP